MHCMILLVTALLCHWATGHYHNYPNYRPYHHRYPTFSGHHHYPGIDNGDSNSNELYSPHHRPSRHWEIPTTTPRVPTQSEIDECIKYCPTTPEYNPLCGDNNATYNNLGHFGCAKNCGVKVEISHAGTCSAPVIKTQVPPTVDTNGKTEATNNSSSNTNTTNPSFSHANYDKERENGVSQGTNNNNAGGNRENGANGANSGNCDNAPSNVNNGIGNGINNGGNEATANNPPTLGELNACMQSCPLTIEYNPVCGTDGVTYSNPGRFLCSQFCGIDVRVKMFSPCSPDLTSDTPNNLLAKVPEDKPEIATDDSQACLDKCSVPDVEMPVCGNNGITYKNLESLKCAKQCHIKVEIQHSGACAPDGGKSETPNIQQITNTAVSIEECMNQCCIGTTYEPLCGTNNITYINRAHFDCVRGCKVDVEIKERAPCPNYKGLPPGQQETETPNQNETDSTTPESDSAESIDIDPRFG